MRKKTSASLFVGILAVSLAATPCYGSATQNKITAAQDTQQKSQEQLNDTQGRIDSLESKKDDLEGYLAELNKQLSELGRNLQVLQEQSKKKQDELDILGRELAAAQEREAEQYASMKLRIQYMYENADVSYLTMFLEAENFVDFLSHAENISQMTKYDRRMLEKYKETTAEIKEKEECIKEEQAKLDKLKQESLNKQDEISAIMKSTNIQIAAYEEKISAERSNVQLLMSQIENQKDIINSLIKQQKDEEAAVLEGEQQESEKKDPATDTGANTPPKNESTGGSDTGNTEDTPESDPDQGADSGSSQGTYLGKFRLTAYCNGPCCGGHSSGLTASGTVPVQGRTVAMGGVPFGTKLMINGYVYVVEDRGVPYGHVDIFHNSHEDAMEFGSTYADVYQVN